MKFDGTAIHRAAVNAGKCLLCTNSPLQKTPENACFRLVNSSEHKVRMRKTAVNGRIHVVFHRLTEQQQKVKRRKMPFNEFSRIHYRGKTLENACFRLDNSCEHFVHRAKNVGEQKKTWHFPCVIRTANSGKHYVFPYLQTLTFPENACFQLLTPVNTLLFTRKMPMNKRKTRCLPCVNRAVNAGK